MSDVYALKQPRPDGGEWIQEFDSLEEAVQYQSHNGGALVKRQPLPGQPGLWWTLVDSPDAPNDHRPQCACDDCRCVL